MFALVVIVFVGFAPSFYLRGLVQPAAPLAPLRIDTIVHGVLASLFMLAFPLQALLVGQGKVRTHVAIGRWTFILGSVLVPLGYLAGARAYHAVRPVPVPIPRGMLEALVSIDVTPWNVTAVK